jgi:hypothetical protein
LKSQISSHHLKLAQAIYKDACAKCAVELSRRDLNTLRSRFEDEGMSFLTITLPDFCQDFEKSLDQGFVAPNLFIRFKKSKRIPAFLQGFLGRIFDRETGRIYDYDESINSTHRPAVNTADLVASVRQICLAFKKIKHSCSPEREKKAIRGFVENEHALMCSRCREKMTSFQRCLFCVMEPYHTRYTRGYVGPYTRSRPNR